MPRLPRLPGGTPGHESARGRVDREARARSRVRDRRARRFLPEELLLPRPSQGLSDLSVRSAVLHQWQRATTDCGRRPCDRNRAGAPGGGRCQDRPRRRTLRTHRWRRGLPRRLQPRRHAARRDRHRSRHPLGRRGEAVPPAPAADDRRARDLGRRDGEGNAARRCERLGSPGRLGRAPHANGDQEHELVQLHRARDRGRDRAPDRGVGVGRGGAPAHVRLRRRDGHAHGASREGGGGRLSLFPGAGPRPRSSRHPSWWRRSARSCPSRPLPGYAASSPVSTSTAPRCS